MIFFPSFHSGEAPFWCILFEHFRTFMITQKKIERISLNCFLWMWRCLFSVICNFPATQREVTLQKKVEEIYFQQTLHLIEATRNKYLSSLFRSESEGKRCKFSQNNRPSHCLPHYAVWNEQTLSIWNGPLNAISSNFFAAHFDDARNRPSKRKTSQNRLRNVIKITYHVNLNWNFRLSIQHQAIQ